jgi:ribosomal-protein-alanine N-acetyltransferase
VTEGLEILAASAVDLDQVMTVMNKAFDPRHGEAWTAAQCAGALSLPGSMLVLARDGGRTLGFGLARSVVDEAELLLIAVRPDGQRRGVGKKLIGQIIDELAAIGVKSLHLEVRSDNPALAFYSRLGFEKVGQRRNYYRGIDGELTDAVTLSRQIA